MKIANQNNYLNRMSSYNRLLTGSYYLYIILLAASVISSDSTVKGNDIAILWENTWTTYYSTSPNQQFVGVLTRCYICVITALTIGNFLENVLQIRLCLYRCCITEVLTANTSSWLLSSCMEWYFVNDQCEDGMLKVNVTMFDDILIAFSRNNFCAWLSCSKFYKWLTW